LSLLSDKAPVHKALRYNFVFQHILRNVSNKWVTFELLTMANVFWYVTSERLARQY